MRVEASRAQIEAGTYRSTYHGRWSLCCMHARYARYGVLHYPPRKSGAKPHWSGLPKGSTATREPPHAPRANRAPNQARTRQTLPLQRGNLSRRGIGAKRTTNGHACGWWPSLCWRLPSWGGRAGAAVMDSLRGDESASSFYFGESTPAS